MKKTFKKILSLTIVAAIIFAFSMIPALATENPPTTWTPTSTTAGNTLQTIKVYNLKENTTVRAYQIVKGTYKDGKLTGYELCDSTNANLANITAPTADELTTIANNIQSGAANLDYVTMTPFVTYEYKYHEATVEAGEYIILATESNPIMVYNPAIVSVKVTDANLLSTSVRDLYMNSQFSDGNTAYMKSSQAIIGKRFADTNGSTNTASYGDIVNFKITNTNVPSYSEDYASPLIFRITDKLYYDDLEQAHSPYLGVFGLQVKANNGSFNVFGAYNVTGDEVEVPEVTGEGAEAVRNYTIKYYDESGAEIENQTAENLKHATKYTIEFTDAFIRANGMKNIIITYSSTLTSNAKLALQDYSGNFTSNRTIATLQYSNDPEYDPENDTDNNPPYKEILSSATYTYTFGIDAVGDGIQTYEFNKVTQAGGAYQAVEDADSGEEITQKSEYALAGATFTLYSDRDMTQDQDHIIGTATSDSNGHIEFRGLGAGTYYLKETSAPSDYTLNENNYKIVISASSPASSYTITTYLMGETDTQLALAKYTRSYTGGTHIEPTVTPAEVVNTQLATLPTTGGIGTIVISVVAGLGMAIFLTVFVISKKRSSKKN